MTLINGRGLEASVLIDAGSPINAGVSRSVF